MTACRGSLPVRRSDTLLDEVATWVAAFEATHGGALGMSEDRDLRRASRRRRRRRRDGGLEAPAATPPPVPPVPPAPPTAPAAPSEPGTRLSQREAEWLAGMDESLLSADERAYLEARRMAEHKVEFYREAVKLGVVVVPLLLIPFTTWLGAIVLFFGGIRLARKYYALLVEPGLRRRIVTEEVAKRVRADVHRERREVESEHTQRLEKLSASIAHEIRNPITAAKSLVQQMEEDPASHDNVEYARVALAELDRVERSVSHLLKYAREENLRLQPVRLAEVLDSALETFRERAERSGIEIRRHFDSHGEIEGDAEKLRRVFINLVGNAIEALEDGSRPDPRVEVSLGENLARTEVWVRVRDNGPGIDDDTRRRIFEPFFTSKERGTGLGLAITRKLVDAHGGEIELDSSPGMGSEFVISLPKQHAAASEGELS